jgi:hypothetical protein
VETRAPRRSVARDVLPAVAILLVTWLLMWLVGFAVVGLGAVLFAGGFTVPFVF